MRKAPRPDSGYAWLIVALGALSIAIQTGILWGGALFLIAISDDTGWSRSTVATAFSLYLFGNGAWAPVVGWLIRAQGARRVISVGAVLLALGLAGLSTARDPLVFSVLIVALAASGGMAVGSLPNYAVAQNWFRRRRGLALGLVDAGSGLGLAAVVPLTQWFIAEFGWRGAYQALACLVLLLVPLHLLLQRPAPLDVAAEGVEQPGRSRFADAGLLLGSRWFRVTVSGLMTIWFLTSLVVVHHAAYLRDQGFEPAQIAAAFAILGTSGIVGRVAFGWLSDRFGIVAAYAAVIVCGEVGLGLLVLAGSSGELLPLASFAIVFGASLGVGTIMFARRLTELFGSHMFGPAMGLAFPCASMGGAIGSWGAGVAFDATGTYLTSFAAAAVAALASFGCMWLLRAAPTEREPRFSETLSIQESRSSTLP